MIWAWAFFRRSLIAQIIAGVAAFLAAWAANNAIVGYNAKQAERKRIVKKSNETARKRDAKIRKIRKRVDRNDAWDRLRRDYAAPDRD